MLAADAGGAADDVVGAWLADGWIEQSTSDTEEEIRREDATSDRFELAAKARDAVERLLDGSVENSGASSVGSVS